MFKDCEGRTEEMEEVLIERCKGTEYFVDNLLYLSQAQIFDKLSEIVRYEMESPFRNKAGKRKSKAKAKAI